MTIYFKNGFYAEPQENSVELTDEQYEALVIGQSQGKQIVTDDDGFPILVELQPSQYHELKNGKWIISEENATALLNEKREIFIRQIDSHAAGIYSQWTRFESEYRERKSVAEAYKAANYEGECSRYISDFAQRAGIDNKAATNLILMQAEGLEKLQVELANQRMRKYELKAPNLTLEQLQSIHDDIIKQMDNLMEAYQNG